MNVLCLSGSRNPAGQTARAAEALLQGVREAGGSADIVFLPSLRIERCRQCDAGGWGSCRPEGRCVIDDDFTGLLEKMRAADALVFATPVYFSDLSESLKAFLDRFRRVSLNADGRRGIEGKPAVGICVAGGGGGGAPMCAMLLDRTLATCKLNVVDMVLARRQNLEMKLGILPDIGRWLVGQTVAG